MTVIGRRSYSIIIQFSLYLLYMNILIAQKGDFLIGGMSVNSDSLE